MLTASDNLLWHFGSKPFLRAIRRYRRPAGYATLLQHCIILLTLLVL